MTYFFCKMGFERISLHSEVEVSDMGSNNNAPYAVRLPFKTFRLLGLVCLALFAVLLPCEISILCKKSTELLKRRLPIISLLRIGPSDLSQCPSVYISLSHTNSTQGIPLEGWHVFLIP